jgi:hypothetical protein
VDEGEPNDSFAEATEFAADSVVVGDLNYSDGRDVFKVLCNKGKILNVSLIQNEFNPTIPWEYNLDYEVITTDPTHLIIEGHWWQEKKIDAASMFCLETGYYYIWVYANGTGSEHTKEVNYTLSASVSDPTVITTGTTTDSFSTITDTYQDRWYKVDIPAGTGLGADLTSPQWGDYDIYLYNNWPHLPNYTYGNIHPLFLNGSWENGTNIVESVTGLAGEGSYLIKVQGYTGAGTFQLSTYTEVISDDGDNTPADATFVEKTKITLSNIHQSRDHVDWYKFHLSENEKVTVVFDLTAGTGDLYNISLYDGSQSFVTGQFDTVTGKPYHFTNNPVDSNAAISNYQSSYDGDYYLCVRAVRHIYQTGENNYVPAASQYRLTWTLPNYGPTTLSDVGDLSMNEDEVYTGLNLNDYFDDPENDTLEFTATFEVAQPDINVVIDANGNVTISAQPDFNTDGVYLNLTFRATDPAAIYGFKYNTSKARLKIDPVNDKPKLKNPISDVVMFEDEIRYPTPSNLSKIFEDVDGDNLIFRVTGNNNIPISVDLVTSIIEIGPVVGWYGTEVVTATAEDPTGATNSTEFEIMVEHVNHPPEPAIAKNVYLNITEDQTDESLSVSTLFTDIDTTYANDELTIALGGSVLFHMEVEIKETGKLSIVPEHNWSGTENVDIVAKDKNGSQETVIVHVIVNNVNDAPVISVVTPQGEFTEINEGESKVFSVDEIIDSDTSEQFFNYMWYINGERQTDISIKTDNLKVTTDYDPTTATLSAGNHTIKVEVTDGELTATREWTLVVKEFNRPPTGVKITGPENNFKTTTGKKVLFSAADATDPDGDVLTYTWYDASSEKTLGTGQVINAKFSETGQHLIKLFVTDGKGGNTSKEVRVQVTKSTDGGGMDLGGLMMPLLAIIVVIIIVVVLVIVLKKRGGSKPEIPPERDEGRSEAMDRMFGPQEGAYQQPAEPSAPPAEAPPPAGPPAEEPPAAGPPPGPPETGGADEGPPTWKPE